MSTNRAKTLGDDGRDLVLWELTRPLAGSLDQRSQLVVRQLAQRLVDLGEAGAGGQEGGPG